MRDNTILVVVDPTAGSHQPALERAAWLAKQAGARLDLFSSEYDPDLDSARAAAAAPAARERLLEAQRRALEDLAGPLRKQGLTVSVDVVWDHPFDAAIVNKAAAHDYWLVAKDTHHHNLVQRTLLTNVDWHLIRKCPVPLLLVKDRKLAAEPTCSRPSIPSISTTSRRRSTIAFSRLPRTSLACCAVTCTSCIRMRRRSVRSCLPTS